MCYATYAGFIVATLLRKESYFTLVEKKEIFPIKKEEYKGFMFLNKSISVYTETIKIHNIIHLDFLKISRLTGKKS